MFDLLGALAQDKNHDKVQAYFDKRNKKLVSELLDGDIKIIVGGVTYDFKIEKMLLGKDNKSPEIHGWIIQNEDERAEFQALINDEKEAE
jgi:hypothetical protein